MTEIHGAMPEKARLAFVTAGLLAAAVLLLLVTGDACVGARGATARAAGCGVARAAACAAR